MMIKKPDNIPSSEITDEKHYINRRTFLRGAVLVASATATGLLYRAINPATQQTSKGLRSNKPQTLASYSLPDGEKATPYQDITNYNNFYEFSADKQSVAPVSKNFITRPWTISVEGLVHKPKVFDIDSLLKIALLEDRIYRHRCVEAWSMVIPWYGFSLARLLNEVQPMSNARYVRFVTLHDPKQMPNQKTDLLQWPYEEGLRLDEAMHPLTTLASGIYGKALLPQNGAPLRLVVPWKYGFKGCKSIVKIELTAKQPETTWNIANSREYGFYSNVNPHVDHPRWSQAMERRIGDFGLRPTVMFNGYGEQVAQLYSGMDLAVNF